MFFSILIYRYVRFNYSLNKYILWNAILLSNGLFSSDIKFMSDKFHLGIIVVIPCHNELHLIDSLLSLKDCDIPTSISIEVITIINAGEHGSAEIKKHNQETFKKSEEWAEENSSNKVRFLNYLNNDLPKKHAGVGLARKIGMDEAVDRFEQVNNANGVIVCFVKGCPKSLSEL